MYLKVNQITYKKVSKHGRNCQWFKGKYLVFSLTDFSFSCGPCMHPKIVFKLFQMLVWEVEEGFRPKVSITYHPEGLVPILNLPTNFVFTAARGFL